MAPTRALDTVVIAGGSIAGLLAAAAAAPLARRVVVLERDPLPDLPETRTGTPQAAHSHGLLASGRAAVEELLPGFTDAMRAHGAHSRGDLGSIGRWWIGGGLIADCALGQTGLAASRLRLEHTLCGLVRELGSVEIQDSADVVALRGDRTHVDGVVVRRRGADEPPWTIDADLVVDATGRAGRGWRWLTELGVPEPTLERTVIGLRYVTCHVKALDADLDGRVVVVSSATPDTPRGGVAIRQEDDTWTLTLFGYGEEAPPVDPDGLRRFATRVVSPDLAALLADRDPLDDGLVYRFPDCRRRRVEELKLPLGYAAVGDSICSFDPTFGQGMSVAALEAGALQAALMNGLEAVRSDYPQQAARIVDGAWSVVQGAVLQLPTTVAEGPSAPAAIGRYIGRYIGRLQRVARRDPVVAAAFLRVTNLMASPSTLLAPRIAYRVLRPGATDGTAG